MEIYKWQYSLIGRIFVHEWAHLRWGVFDEYNVDRPFYISRKNTIEATRYHPIEQICFQIFSFMTFKFSILGRQRLSQWLSACPINGKIQPVREHEIMQRWAQ